VIGNPPYVKHGRIKDIKAILKKQGYKVFNSEADLYVYFYEKGIELLKDKGILSYITSNKWFRSEYGENLRKYLKENTKIIKVIDFSGYKVFKQAVDTNIIILQKEKPTQDWEFEFIEVKDNSIDNVVDYIKNNYGKMKQKDLSDNGWTFGDEKVLNLKKKIEKVGKPLKDWNVKIYFGIKTGFNDAFIIDEETRNEILKNCKTEEERKRTEKIIKPILRGRDIEKWRYKWEELWLIKIEAGWTNRNRGSRKPEEFFKNTFPSLYDYFMTFKDYKGRGKGLFNRDDQGDYWWELRPCDYYQEFEKEKIVWAGVGSKLQIAIVPRGFYINAPANFMTSNSLSLKYLAGLLNSKTVVWYYEFIKTQLGEKGGRFYVKDILNIPLPPITPQNKEIVKDIEELVDEILKHTQSPDYETNKEKQAQVKELEKQIDQLVYKLYNLTEEEIRIIEEN
jgi:type II restriction/modification system DNA methylase subunit YeeA